MLKVSQLTMHGFKVNFNHNNQSLNHSFDETINAWWIYES